MLVLMGGAGSFLDIESFICNRNLTVQRQLNGSANTANRYGALRSTSQRTYLAFFSLSYVIFTVYRKFNISEKLLEGKRQNLGRITFHKQEVGKSEACYPDSVIYEILCFALT